MINWLNPFKHLLPRARAWCLTTIKNLREFFEGLTGLPEDTNTFFDNVYNDLEPQKTRELSRWEKQFALLDAFLTEQQRRDRLEATWKALGGQSPRYIQDTLQAAGFDVFIHEWWEPIPGRPNGGSIDGDVVPVARNPFDFLNDGTVFTFLMTDGVPDAQDGDSVSQDGGTSVPVGYPLVNKILTARTEFIGDGDPDLIDGGQLAQDGGVLSPPFIFIPDIIPKPKFLMGDGVPDAQDGDTVSQDGGTSTKFPFFLYIGGAIFPEQAFVAQSRRDEFENLCLKICPLEQWLGILVTYS